MNYLIPHRHSPSAERNRKPILAVLEACLPKQGTILEIASGTGQHGRYFIERLPNLYWQPSDPDKVSRGSISAWWWVVQLNNVLPPLDINTQDKIWQVEKITMPQPITSIVCINMTHISPWASTVGLLKGASRILPQDGILYLYGPYMIDGRHTAPGNEAFDLSLRAQNPEWGVRDLTEVKKLASQHGLNFEKTVDMPANNLSVIFRKP